MKEAENRRKTWVKRMPSIKRNKIVPYSIAQMYELVNDIERYPDFLPGCQAATILHRDADEVKATLVLAKAGIHHSFTTLNRLQHNKMIEVRLVEGPFRHLEGFWHFNEVNTNEVMETGEKPIKEGSKGCHIAFDLEFELSNRLLSMTLGSVLNTVANKFIDAFCDRAKAVYGLR